MAPIWTPPHLVVCALLHAPSTSAPAYWHFMSWPMALKGGASPYLFDQGIPVQPRPGIPSYNVAKTDALEIRQASEFDFDLVHGWTNPAGVDRSVRLTSTIGDWTLFDRVAPMPDEP